jgi:hypothetical protein
MSHLILFVDSLRPDTYVNSVMYNLRQGGLQKVTFAHVHSFPGDEGSSLSGSLSSKVMAAVLNSIKSLASKAEYHHLDERTTPLSKDNGSFSADEIRRYYSAGDESPVVYESVDVNYRELRSFLKKMKRENPSYILDVTSCRKRFFGDFIALGLVDDFTDIRTFDVLTPPDYGRPWTMLVHELEQRSPVAFKYVDIMETRIMMACSRAVMIRAPRFWSAWVLAGVLVAIGVAMNAYVGLDSDSAKWINVVAQFATFAALVFVFFPPRSG